MTVYKVVFFILHCLVHLFGYWIPCVFGACVDLLLCRPCHNYDKKRHGFTYHPAREVRIIHNPELTEAAVHVFGLMDVCSSALEDRQYCALALSRTQIAEDAKRERRASTSTARHGEVSCEKSASLISNDHPSASVAAQGNNDVAVSRSPLEPPQFNSEKQQPHDTYNSQRYPHLSSTAPQRTTANQTTTNATNAMAELSAAAAAMAPPDTTTAPTAMKRALHIPNFAPPNRAVKKEIKRCRLTYSAPLYGPHIGTILGALRPNHPISYVREEMRAWDGCYLVMDWCYVNGEAPVGYDHEHTSRERKAETAWGCCERADGNVMNEPFSHVRGEAAVTSPSPLAHKSHPENRGASNNNDCSDTVPTLVAAPAQTNATNLGGVASESKSQTHKEKGQEWSWDKCDGAVSATHPLREQATSDESLKPAIQGRTATLNATQRTTRPRATEVSSKAMGVVFIVPGLTSHAQSNYVQHLVEALHKAHLHVCILTTRGMGDSPPISTPFLFNGAYTRDVRDCLQHFFTKGALAARFGHPLPLIGIGLSIGGAILSKYIGEEGIAGADPHLDAFICCCSPMDYVMTVEHMNRNGAQRAVYQRDMCNDIRNYLLRYPPLQHMPNVDNEWVFVQGNLHRFRRVVHFDEHVIAKSAGYRSTHHYHIDASAVTWLPYSPIPVLAISTADDPVIGRTVMPHRWREIVANNARLVYAEPPVGGHLGFLGNPWEELMNHDNWMETFLRDRVLAACAYWYAVQHQAEETGRGGGKATASRHSPASPETLFSPTTSTAAAAATKGTNPTGSSAVSPEASQHPSLCLMRALAPGLPGVMDAREKTASSQSAVTIAGGSNHFTEAVNNEQGGDNGGHGEASVFTEEDSASVHDEGQNVFRATLLDEPANAVASDGTDLHKANEPVLHSDSLSPPMACSSQLPQQMPEANKKSTTSPPVHKTGSFSALRHGTPRPIQYLPPREDRPTNRCYFTYYSTPAVPLNRLRQPYFTTELRNGACEKGDVDENDGYTSLSTNTTCLDDGRSSMYSTGFGAGGNNANVNGNDRRRSIYDDCEANAGVRAMGKDSRCMMMTGQYTYAPVVVNCDYVGDPRTMMLDD